MQHATKRSRWVIGSLLVCSLAACGTAQPTTEPTNPPSATAAISQTSTSASYQVEVWNPPFDFASPRTTTDYVPLVLADKAETICVSIPHIKDTYWLAVNYGIVSEAERLGVNVEIVEAGGYGNLPTQITQIRQCVANGAKAVVIGSISLDGLNELIVELQSQKIPVIAFMNDISSKAITAKSLSVPGEGGQEIAKYLVQKHPKGSEPVDVAWFPGPEKAGWSKAADQKFKATITDGAINIVETKYGDTGKEEQAKLIEEVLIAHPEIDYIVGTGQTTVTAAEILRERKLQDKIKLMAYYISPEVYAELKSGGIQAAAVAPPVTIARIALDQTVRILEGKEYMAHVGPKSFVIDTASLTSFDPTTSIPPETFKITLRVSQ